MADRDEKTLLNTLASAFTDLFKAEPSTKMEIPPQDKEKSPQEIAEARYSTIVNSIKTMLTNGTDVRDGTQGNKDLVELMKERDKWADVVKNPSMERIQEAEKEKESKPGLQAVDFHGKERKATPSNEKKIEENISSKPGEEKRPMLQEAMPEFSKEKELVLKSLKEQAVQIMFAEKEQAQANAAKPSESPKIGHTYNPQGPGQQGPGIGR
jgi:hypothetical protein